MIKDIILYLGQIGIVFISVFLGFRQYGKQKTWENIEKKYFENGIDALILYLNNIRSLVEYNYVQSIDIIKYFKIYDAKVFLEWLKSEDAVAASDKQIYFFGKIPDCFLITQRLFNSKILDRFCIKIFSGITAMNGFYMSFFPFQLKRLAQELANCDIESIKETKELKKKYIEFLDKELREKYEYFDKEFKIYELIDVLENVLIELRKMDISSYEKLDKIKKNKKIIEILKMLEMTEEMSGSKFDIFRKKFA